SFRRRNIFSRKHDSHRLQSRDASGTWHSSFGTFDLALGCGFAALGMRLTMPTSASQTAHRNRSHREPDVNVCDRWSNRLVDVALMASVFVVPCLLGGRIALGHFVLAACATLAALGWSAGILFGRRPTWSVTWV